MQKKNLSFLFLCADYYLKNVRIRETFFSHTCRTLAENLYIDNIENFRASPTFRKSFTLKIQLLYNCIIICFDFII